MVFCDICKSSPGNAVPIYPKLRDKNLPAREDQFFLTHTTAGGVPDQCRLNVLGVQRATLHALQLHVANLIGIILKPGRGGGDCDDWAELAEYLHKYCTALRDLDYLHTRAEGQTHEHAFCISSTRQIERDILEHAGLLPFHMNPQGPALPAALDANKVRLGWRTSAFIPTMAPPQAPPAPALVAPPPTQGATRGLERFGIAMAGALSLLVPVYIMILVEGKPVNLITATVAILLVALVMGLSSLEIKAVLSITSGYAAVMIVFLGTQKITWDQLLEG